MKRLLLFIIITVLCCCNLTAVEPLPRYSYVLMEGTTAALLYSDNGNYSFPVGHSAKLMTVMLVAEGIEAGLLTVDTTVKVSQNANSMEGTQIWLRIGEEIPISDLILAVTAGNANDACVALAEAVAGDEQTFVKLMNDKCASLGMSDTYYADCTGLSDGSYTTASDTAIIASHLSRYQWLDDYFTQYISYVRGGQTQLVNTNRLIRTYDFCTGMKYYYSDKTGHCVIASARKDGLTMICVIMGEQDKDTLFKTAKEKLGIGFSAYTLYKPRATDVYCRPVSVSNGVKEIIDTRLGELSPFVVRKSKLEDIEVKTEYYDNISAPVMMGDIVGRIVYSVDDTDIYSVLIIAAEGTDRLTFISALKKILSFLIRM